MTNEELYKKIFGSAPDKLECPFSPEEENRCKICGANGGWDCQLEFWKSEAKTQCKNCLHYVEDLFIPIGTIPIIGAHHVCTRWQPASRTNPDGFCFMFEEKKND